MLVRWGFSSSAALVIRVAGRASRSRVAQLRGRRDRPGRARRGGAIRVDTLVKAGRLTEEDAARLRAVEETDELHDVAREIQLRHARKRVGEAVQEGILTEEEARTSLDRLADGEDPRFLRGLRRGRRPRVAADR